MRKTLFILISVVSTSYGAMNFFNEGVYVPMYPDNQSGVPNFTNMLVIDAADEKVAAIIQAPKTGSIRKAAWRTGAVTTGATSNLRIETVVSGLPSGTLFATNASSTFTTVNTDDNVWMTSGGLVADCPVLKGDVLAVVIVGGATPGSGAWTGFNDQNGDFAYSASSNSSSGYAKAVSAKAAIGLEYSDGTYYPINDIYPFETVTNVTISTNTTPNTVGNKFRFPIDVSLSGFWLWADTDGDGDVVVFNSDGQSVISTYTVVNANRGSAGGALSFYIFPSTVTLTANTYYRIALRANTATSSVIYRLDSDSAATMEAAPYGTEMIYTSAKDPYQGNAWTDVNTQRAQIGLILNGFGSTAASSTGGAFPFVQ